MIELIFELRGKSSEAAFKGVLCKKVFLEISQNSTGKHLCQSLFLNEVAGLSSATLLKKRFWHRSFPVNFVKFLRTPFLQNTSGRLLLKAVNYFHQKISITYVWKGSKCTSAAVSISCIVIKKNVKIKLINADLFKDFSGNTHLRETYPWF